MGLNDMGDGITLHNLFQIEVKMEDIENNNSQLGDLKKQLGTLIKDCEGLYGTYNEKRNKVEITVLLLVQAASSYLVLGRRSFWQAYLR